MNQGLLFAIGASIVWGLAYVIDQKVLANLSPISFLFIASACTALVLLPFAFNGSLEIRAALSHGRSAISLLLLSVVLTLLANYFILASIGRLGASTASIIEISYPIFVVLFSIALLGTTPTWPVLAGGALIIIGAAIVVRSI